MLDITIVEKNALIQFIKSAEENKIIHFDMRDGRYCIGGWMQKYISERKRDIFAQWFFKRKPYVDLMNDMSLSLYPLFFPPDLYYNANLEQVIPVCKHFLETGEILWQLSGMPLTSSLQPADDRGILL